MDSQSFRQIKAVDMVAQLITLLESSCVILICLRSVSHELTQLMNCPFQNLHEISEDFIGGPIAADVELVFGVAKESVCFFARAPLIQFLDFLRLTLAVAAFNVADLELAVLRTYCCEFRLP